tara:strand:+ start:1062 stop:1343 length:282 start_codon:yes stop_codon:yes gene_type:complete
LWRGLTLRPNRLGTARSRTGFLWTALNRTDITRALALNILAVAESGRLRNRAGFLNPFTPLANLLPSLLFPLRTIDVCTHGLAWAWLRTPYLL